MKTCIITVTLRDKTFVSKFPVTKDIPEYKLADEAWRLGLMFAETQAIAIFGCGFSANQFAELLKDLDYTYELK